MHFLKLSKYPFFPLENESFWIILNLRRRNMISDLISINYLVSIANWSEILIGSSLRRNDSGLGSISLTKNPCASIIDMNCKYVEFFFLSNSRSDSAEVMVSNFANSPAWASTANTLDRILLASEQKRSNVRTSKYSDPNSLEVYENLLQF